MGEAMNTRDTIKAIIFDFGGVLLGRRSEEERRYWSERLGLKLGQLEEILYGGEEWAQVKVGAISRKEFWQRVGAKLGLHTPEEIAAFRREYFAGDLERLDRQLVDLARQLRGQYRLAVLSNASGVVEQLLRDKLGIGDLFDVALLEDVRPEVRFAMPLPEDYSTMAALCRHVAGEFWWGPVLVLAQYPTELEIAALCSDEEYIVRVARVSGQVAGVALLLQPLPAPLHHTAELSLAVAPEFRRYGIGRGLVEYLLDLAPAHGIELVRAWVCAANGPSRALMESLGFECGARLCDELRRPDGRAFDVLIYHKGV